MTVELVFLLEEPSMEAFLHALLPRLIPDTPYKLIPHEGKSDLEASLPRKLRAWRSPGARFIVVRDQDAADCRVIKQRLLALARGAGKPDTVVRIACRELESWHLGDLEALATAFSLPSVRGQDGLAKFRNPDVLANPSQELKRLVSAYQKRSGSRAIGEVIDPERNRSPSFRVFVAAVLRLAAPEAA